MKVVLYYEDKKHPTLLEAADEEFATMVERDYQRRCDEAGVGEVVSRRSPQEILDEDFNKPTFNRNHAETRRHVLLSAIDPEDRRFVGAKDVESLLLQEDYGDLYRAMGDLRPQQKALIRRIFWGEERQVDIAQVEGVSKSAITQRLATIYGRLRKSLEKNSHVS